MSELDNVIRVGFIGAGSICRTRHLPGLSRIPGVKVVAVSNRTRESSIKISQEFNIPHVENDWKQLIARPDVDAVFIGTWPNMHREMSVAALDAGKHVFCQARMATDLGEAKQMLAASRRNPHLVNMICPPPTRMPFEPFIKHVIASDRLGTLTAVELKSIGGGNLKTNAVHWRERTELSGKQILAMGIYAETLHAWLGVYQTLMAQTAIFLPIKQDAQGNEVKIGVPQSVTITGRLANGALIHEHHSGLVTDRSTPGEQLTVWGLKGTLRYDFGNQIEIAEAGQEFRPVEVPVEQRREWWAEEDFIAAIRLAKAGKPFAVTPDFAEGLLYMQKVEAVHLSSATGRAVNPSEL